MYSIIKIYVHQKIYEELNFKTTSLKDNKISNKSNKE